MENTVIKVGGMSCQGCVKNIGGVLSALAGVSSAEVSLEAAEARVADPSRCRVLHCWKRLRRCRF